MSRIGRAPISIPAGVTVTVSDDNIVTVKGPKGTLTQEVNKNIPVKQEGNEILVTRPNDEKQNRAFHGLYRALIANMVTGVSTGFTKTLNLVGTGYRAEAKGTTLNITIGYSHPVIFEAEENIAFATPNQTTIQVSGINKQQVGNVAAAIRAVRKPEPYHGKGIKYDTEVVRRKEGKTGKK
jgi:large subunit ribosomal protein L6